jgi:hypothetical protein
MSDLQEQVFTFLEINYEVHSWKTEIEGIRNTRNSNSVQHNSAGKTIGFLYSIATYFGL